MSFVEGLDGSVDVAAGQVEGTSAACALPKDVHALVFTGEQAGPRLRVLGAVEAVNERQKHILVDKMVARFGEGLSGERFALWGPAFKTGTDEMREAASLLLTKGLTECGATVCAYDPVAVPPG